MSNKKSLRQQLLVWFLLLSLVPLTAVSTISYLQTREALTKAAKFELEELAKLRAHFIQSWFNYRIMDIRRASEDETYATLLESLTQGLSKSQQSLAEYVKSYDWAKRVSGRDLTIQALPRQYDYIYDIFLIDNQGNIIYTVVKEPDFGTNLYNGPYSETRFAKAVTKTLTTGEDAFSDLERYAPSSGVINGFLTSVLVNQEGEKIGALAIQVKVERIFSLMQNKEHIAIKQYLIGSDTTLRTPIDNDHGQVLKHAIRTHQVDLWLEDFKLDKHHHLAHAVEPFHDHASAKSYIGPKGDEVFGVHNPIRINDIKWAVISEIDVNTALASTSWIAYLTVLLISATVVVVWLIARTVSGRITQPIYQLSQASIEAAQGKNPDPVAIKTNNEIGQLADAFNHMLKIRQQYEAKLIDAKEAAVEGAKAKSEFLASMSHEIRTPMNGVLGMLSLIQHSALTKDQRHQVKLALSSAESLLSVINDILDFSKVEAGKLELEILDFNLRDTLGDVAESISQKAQDKGLEVILDVTQVTASNVRGDPGRIRQILMNLIGNAIKFTETGEIYIRASLVEESSALRLKCLVSDTGIGIPQASLETLFDSFTQVDASTTRRYGGTGLGLAITKQLCQLMNGDIKVSSQAGEGSDFEFDIELMPSEQSQPVLPEIDIEGKLILIVDDNATYRRTLRQQLEIWGAIVTEAESARDALTLLEAKMADQHRSAFDIAFLDMQMPDTDGAALGRQLRADQRFDNTKLIIMTSMSNRGDAKSFHDIGFNAYFPKPFTTSDIFDALSVLVEDRINSNQDHLLFTHQANSPKQDNLNSKLSFPKQTRLLLVEDNYVNQTVVRAILRNWGLGCDAAENGLEAIEMMQAAPENAPYNLVFMDCQMPEMDGYETTHSIRQGQAGERYADITIIAMTANAMAGDKQKCLDAGMDDYLSKPINNELLLEKLKHWLECSKTEEQKNNTEITDSAPPKQKEVIWDSEELLERLQGNVDITRQLAQVFLNELPTLIKDIETAIKEEDFEGVQASAHSLKGSSANINATAMSTLALLFENMAKQADIKGLRKGMSALEEAQRQLSYILANFLDQ